MAVTVEDYKALLQSLLPQGLVWNRDEDSNLGRLLQAMAKNLFELDDRAIDLVAEADPRTAVELLPEWEAMAGLPDACVIDAGIVQSTQQRRSALLTKLTTVGRQSKDYFIALAAGLGFQVTITEFKSFRAGQSVASDRVGEQFALAWQVNSALNTVIPFRAGASVAGDPLGSWSNKPLECLLSRLKPAHTTVIFAYS
ncbi:MAG: YmfQ family protein [Limnobacter sp.]|uniref:YmfQ family protein n=1 Tax=Limnobacter sp. TaxID=2003368 RepID=UPI00391D5BEF